MKTKQRFTFIAGSLVALGFSWVTALSGQTTHAEDPPAPPPASAQEAPAAPEKPVMRVLSETDDSRAPTASHDSDDTSRAAAMDESAADDTDAGYADSPAGFSVEDAGQIVRFGDVLLEADRTVDEVVAIMGSIISEGRIEDSAVAIMGDNTINGSVEGDVVAVLGSVTINGSVDGDVVAVLGNVQLGPNSRTSGEIISVGGRVIRAPGAKVEGAVQQIPFLGGRTIHFEGLRAWVQHCLLLGRPLAFAPHLGWAWGLALSFFGLYLFLSLILGRPIVKCAETLEKRPGMTFLTAVLTLLLTPVLFVLLAFTGIGPLLLIPVIFLASLFGKAAFIAWLGRRLGIKHVALATLVGGLLMLGLYLIPFVGFAVQKLGDFLGLGMVVLAVMQSFNRGAPPPAAAATATTGRVPPPPSPVSSVPPPAPEAPAPGLASAGFTGPSSTSQATAAAPENAVGPTPVNPPPPSWTPPPPPVPPVAAAGATPPLPYSSMPRAGFWLRAGAVLLDAILVGVVSNMLGMEDYFAMSFAIYCVVMWKLRGTTVGGVVCNLKVVRLDDRPLDWSVAVVRGLGGFLSLAAIGLGFFWIAFDPERQAWHDKIAGTVVVRVPQGVSLI